MRTTWSKLGGQLGLGCVALGLLAILLAWNGAAGKDYDQGQIPYLISGGAGGLALVLVGSALTIIQNSRRDRSLLEGQLREVNAGISRLISTVGGASTGATNGRNRPGSETGIPSEGSVWAPATGEPEVVAGRSSFHRPDCRLAAGKDLPGSTMAAALDGGLTPCRICDPVGQPPSAPTGGRASGGGRQPLRRVSSRRGSGGR
ncbi:MAG: hypothetical protein ACYDAD_09265 [Acidimicrobiales bacterium]